MLHPCAVAVLQPLCHFLARMPTLSSFWRFRNGETCLCTTGFSGLMEVSSTQEVMGRAEKVRSTVTVCIACVPAQRNSSVCPIRESYHFCAIPLRRYVKETNATACKKHLCAKSKQTSVPPLAFTEKNIPLCSANCALPQPSAKLSVLTRPAEWLTLSI